MGDREGRPTTAEIQAQENYLLVEALHEASRRYRNVVDQIHEAVFECGADGVLTFVNPAWKNLLGFGVGHSTGRSLYEFIDASDATLVRESLEAVYGDKARAAHSPRISRETVRDGLRIQRGIRFRRSDGSLIQLEMSAQKTASESIIGSLHDVTDRDLLEDQLLAAKELAEEADVAKGLFLAKASHELRTPLNLILGFAEMLEDDGVAGGEKPSLLGRLTVAAHQLLGLVNDILDITQAERNALGIQLQTFSPGAIAEEVCSLFAERAKQEGIPFEVELASPLPDGIVSDPLRVRQILINLIDNAIKFTGPDGIRVRVSNAMIHGHPGVTFRVSDSGEGIPQKRLDWIFGEFNQLHPAGTRSEEGVGLGLAVARRLAHLLEGELRVDSTPGEGSSFELKLPLAHTAKGQREFAQTAILQGRATVY